MSRAMGRGVGALAAVFLSGCGQSASTGGDAGVAAKHDVVASAEAIARFEPTVSARLRPVVDGFRLEGDRLTSVAFRAKHAGLLSAVPLRANDEISFGFGRTHDRQIHLRANGATDATATIDGGRAVYRDVFKATDEIDVATDDALEILYLLRDSSAPTTFAWNVALPTSLNNVVPAEDGGLEIRDGAGETRLRVPRPFVVDARGTRRDARLEGSNTTWTLTFDPNGLQYPVLVDPIVESTVWKHDGRTPMPGRNTYATAHGGKILVVADGGTWEWDGTSYTLKGAAPAGITDGSALASLGTRAVMFGGRNTTYVPTDDTWEWDGATWTKKTLTTRPGPRSHHAMTSVGGKILLFGGSVPSGTGGYIRNDETWTYDGTAWTKLSPANVPPARYGAGMTTNGSTAFMFGGTGPTLYTIMDTWTWDGTNWTSRGTLSGTELSPQMATVGADTYLVTTQYSTTSPISTYKWSGSAWTKLSPTTSPMTGAASGLPFVSMSGKGVLLGGTSESLHSFDGTNWTIGSPVYPGIVATTESGTKLLGLDYNNMTWDFDGTSWTKNAAPEVYTFGGYTTSMATVAGTPWLVAGGATHSWGGSSWTRIEPGGRLDAPGEGYSVASLGSGLFAFGGDSTPTTTYKWVGTSWSTFGTTLSPTARTRAAMQEFGGKILLFGGENRGMFPEPRFLNDLWYFNGTTWDVYLGTKPTVSGEAGMSNVAAVLALVVQPGDPPGPPEVWTWDGTALTKKTISVSPPAVYPSIMGTLNGKAYMPGSRSIATGVNISSMWSLLIGRADGSDCTSGAQCTSGFCVDGMCCDTACGGACQACTAALKGTGSDGACGPIAAGNDPQNECKDDGSPTCGNDGTCDGAGACRKYAMTTACTPRACTADSECSSGFCTDGVCCDKRCAGSCEGCSRALKGSGVDGVCESFAAGTDPKNRCPKDTAENSCNQDGMCDGAGACRAYAVKGTPCGETVCTSASVSGRTCNGAGTCETATTACGAFLCDSTGKACRTTCTADSDCATTAYCDGSGVCKPKASNGTACTAAKECTSGLCVDGVCCNSACGAECEACNEMGKEGTCVPVVGKPRGTRAPCAGGESACAGKCDGSANTCTYPSASTDCGSACAAGSLTKRVCDNKGSCVESVSSCGNYACGDKVCKDKCTAGADCAGSGYKCESGACVPAGGATCTDDGLSVQDGDKITSCSPAVCKGGKCVERCLGTSDCAAGFTCDTSSGNCVPPSQPTEEEGGCAVHGPSTGASSPIAVGALIALGCAIAGRRRRVKTFSN